MTKESYGKYVTDRYRNIFVSDLSEYLYYEMVSYFKDKNFELTDFFKKLKEFLIPLFPNENTFFHTHYKSFCYECTFDLYHFFDLFKFQTNPLTTTISEGIRKYSTLTQTTNTDATIAQDISKKKEVFFSDYKDKAIYNNYPLKAKTYYNYISYSLNSGHSGIFPIIPTEDLVFNIRNYPHCIYSGKKMDKGIQYYNFRKVISEYLLLHTQKSSIPTFENEYSAYLFEKLHYAIQFQKCVNSYCSQKYDSELIKMHYLPLLLYTKLFDTHYLSLSDYCLKTYNHILSNIYTINIDEVLFLLIEIETYNTYLLPSLFITIKDILLFLHSNDICKIVNELKKFIFYYLSYEDVHNSSYYIQLKKYYEQAKNISYPFDDIRSLIENIPSTNISYTFNEVFSRAYYNHDKYDYFGIRRQNEASPPASVNDCRQCLMNYYSIIVTN